MRKLKQLLFRFFVNNFIVNALIRWLGLEKAIYSSGNPYAKFKLNENKSTQENAGYSIRPEINEVLEKSKSDLITAVTKHCTIGAELLDVGCGPGMYLSLFKNSGYKLNATDLNESMIRSASQLIPEAHFSKGNFIEIKFDKKFDFIYCIGVLIYIPRTDLDLFFEKAHQLLNKDGILYLNYPHATSWLDVVYNDLTYIQYSPKTIEKIIKGKFEILTHEHAFDGRKVNLYDHSPYKSLNPDTDRTYKNSYLLIAKKIN